MLVAVDVPAWVAGVRGLRLADVAGGYREPGVACDPAEEGTVDDASTADGRGAGD